MKNNINDATEHTSKDAGKGTSFLSRLKNIFGEKPEENPGAGPDNNVQSDDDTKSIMEINQKSTEELIAALEKIRGAVSKLIDENDLSPERFEEIDAQLSDCQKGLEKVLVITHPLGDFDNTAQKAINTLPVLIRCEKNSKSVDDHLKLLNTCLDEYRREKDEKELLIGRAYLQIIAYSALRAERNLSLQVILGQMEECQQNLKAIDMMKNPIEAKTCNNLALSLLTEKENAEHRIAQLDSMIKTARTNIENLKYQLKRDIVDHEILKKLQEFSSDTLEKESASIKAYTEWLIECQIKLEELRRIVGNNMPVITPEDIRRLERIKAELEKALRPPKEQTQNINNKNEHQLLTN